MNTRKYFYYKCIDVLLDNKWKEVNRFETDSTGFILEKTQSSLFISEIKKLKLTKQRYIIRKRKKRKDV